MLSLITEYILLKGSSTLDQRVAVKTYELFSTYSIIGFTIYSLRRIQEMKLIYTSIFLLAFSNISFAQEFFVFPSQGQSQEQIDRDKVECQVWARQQTGFDPLQTPTAITPPATSGGRQGGILRGGARGAVLGTVTGAITGNTGRGAAIGASSGALIGGFRTADQRRNEQAAQQQLAQQQVAQHSQERGRFNRAYIACLEGKGYSVN